MSERDTRTRTQAVRHMIQERRKFESEPTDALGFFRSIATATRERLGKIERLLKEGRDAEAILLANLGAWSDQALADRLKFEKANFNPDEPRDDRTKEWTKLGDGSDEARLVDVQYRGHFHDVVVDDFLKAMEKVGAKTVRNIGVLGINGVLAIPDGAVLPAGAPKPYFVEIKTGFNPPLTPNQQVIYPLICIGYHATSFDPAIASLGIKPGTLLPPMDILLVYTAGPKQPLWIDSYCRLKGLR